MMTDPTFWVLIAFVGFVVLAFKPAARFIVTGLDTRARRLEAEIKDAAKLREEAQELLAAFQRKQRDALKESEEIIARARSEAEFILSEAERLLEHHMNLRIKQAMEKIAQTEQLVVYEVKEHAIDMAIAASQSLIREHMDKGVSDRMFQHALVDVQRRLH